MISGYSRQQVTRLIARYRKTGRLQYRQGTVSGLQPKHTGQDIRLLAVMDDRHKAVARARESPLGDNGPCGQGSGSCVSGPVRSSERQSTPLT